MNISSFKVYLSRIWLHTHMIAVKVLHQQFYKLYLHNYKLYSFPYADLLLKFKSNRVKIQKKSFVFKSCAVTAICSKKGAVKKNTMELFRESEINKLWWQYSAPCGCLLVSSATEQYYSMIILQFVPPAAPVIVHFAQGVGKFANAHCTPPFTIKKMISWRRAV